MQKMREIKKFIQGKERKETITIKCKQANAGCAWYKFRNPFLMMFRGILNEVFKKLPPSRFKNSLYRIFCGMQIGKDMCLSPDVHFDPLFPELITIGDNALLGWGVEIVTHDIVGKNLILGKVSIENNFLAGGFSSIHPGVHIGKNCIVGKGALVIKDVPEGDILGGVPAKSIQARIKNAN